MNFPAISLRNSMERPEAQDAGTITLTGFDPDIVLGSVRTTITEFKARRLKQVPVDYQIQDTSWRVLKLVYGLSRLSNKWDGINTA